MIELKLTAKHVKQADMYGNNWGCPLAKAAVEYLGIKVSAGVETITCFPNGQYTQYSVNPPYYCRDYSEDKEKAKLLDDNVVLRTFKITKI